MNTEETSSAWWLETFRPFSAQHAITVAVCLSIVAALAWLGRRLSGAAVSAGRTSRASTESSTAETAVSPDARPTETLAPPGEKRLRFALAIVVLVTQAFGAVWWLLPAQFDPRVSFPLHLCDLVAWAGPFALLFRNRWLRSALYFFGVGLSSQAFVTPILDVGAAQTNFWLFWGGHTQILAMGIYDIAVRGFRPSARDLGRATLLGMGYVAVILPINIAFGLNYGFVGQDMPQTPTVISLLPPWPWRVLVIVAAAEGVMAALWLIWPLCRAMVRKPGRSIGAGRPGHPSGSD